MKISSPAFWNNAKIPTKFTADGADVNPPFRIEDAPEQTKSLAIIVDDPDAPGGTWVHWVVWNIPPTENIFEDNVPGTEGLNDFNKKSYGGPAPPSGTHRYFFKIYALDTMLDIDKDSRKPELVAAMKGHILAQGEVVGTYSRD